jgi:amino acid transporter
MNEMSETSASTTTTRISSFVLLVVFITLALSLLALIFSVSIIGENSDAAWIMLLLGLLGVAMSTYVLVQTRRRLSKLKIVVPPVNTTIECKKCGIKNVREFQRGDYIFKETEPCQKCSDKMLITAIYREVKEKEKERFPF